MNKANKLVKLQLRMSFRGVPESIEIASMSAEVVEKGVWYIHDASRTMNKITVNIKDDTVPAYAELMMKYLALRGIPFTIKE